jgi:hypothetical protein
MCMNILKINKKTEDGLGVFRQLFGQSISQVM